MDYTLKSRDEHVPSEAERFLNGQSQAELLLRKIKRFVPNGDEVFAELLIISKSGDLAELRGFARSLQKALESSK